MKEKNQHATDFISVDHIKIIQSLGEIYSSLYYIDLSTGCFTELSSVDSIHKHIGAEGNAQDTLNYFCHNMMLPEFTEEMLAFVDLSTLNERLVGTRIITKQFASTLFSAPESDSVSWKECSFIECDRDSDGKLAHVIFGTQSINEAKRKELEALKKLRETNDELTALLVAEKQHTEIIGSLSNVYFALYRIDLKKNTIKEVVSTDELRKLLIGTEKADSALKLLVNALVTPAYKQRMRSFTDFESIDERLGNKPIIIQEYVAQSGGWTRCSFFSVNKDENGKNSTVLCTFRNITNEKEVVESQDNLIQALALSYSNIYAVDMNTCQAVCYRMGKTMSSRYGHKFVAGNYEKNVSTYVKNDVFPEDRRLFDQVRTIDGVRDLLSNKVAFYFNYRVFRDGTVQYYQCQLVKPRRERNEFVIAFKNVDEEKKQEFAQKREVEKALASVEKINEMLLDEMEITNALTKEYPDVFLINFEKNSTVTVKVRGKMIAEEDRSAGRAYDSTWRSYISGYVVREDKGKLKEAVSAAAVKRALQNSDEYPCSFRMKKNGVLHHCQAVFMRVYSRHNADGQIILGIRNVDAIVEEESKHAKIQEEQLRIINALSQEYHSLFKIDSRTGEMSLYRTDGMGMSAELIDKLISIGNYEFVLAKYIDNFIVPEDRDRIRASSKLEVLLEKVPEVGLYKQGYRRQMNGVVSYYEMNVVKTTDESGTVTFILGMRDVDDETRRQLNQAKKIEAQRDIIEGLASEYYSVLLVDPATDTVTAYRSEDEDGQAIAQHFHRHGYCWSKGIRSYAEELVSDSSREEFLKKLSLDYIRNGISDYSLTYEKLKSNGVMYLQARVSFVREENGSFVVVIGTRNVDDLIKKEREQELALQEAYFAAETASKAKTDFLSNMSHDIRTPMNGIIGMTAIAIAHIDDKDRVYDSLQKITHASKHLLSLINEVLDMSKIESGKVNLVEEEFTLSDLIDNLMTMNSSQIEEHHHELSVNISGVVHEAVVGDSLRIQKVFTNILSNAIKYTPDGGKIKLSISEKPSNQAKIGFYEFVFEDNGIGISEDFIGKVFEPFARASDSRVDKIQGTGLGMSISRNLVRMMGGDIVVQSKLNEGSRFIVTMYLKLQDSSEVRYDKFVDLDVLVADDDDTSLESCCGMLNDFGMKAEGVSTGAEAVEKVVLHHLQKRDYFACILDWKMPDMDGIAATKAIRKAVGKDVPIIIISAYDWSDIEQEARAAGANAFISKPLFRSKVAKTFSALVGGDEEQPETSIIGFENIDLSNRRALVVEDNQLNAEIAGEILKMTGLSVEFATNGKEAVDKMAESPDGYFDIVFMDIQMPIMNGYDATRAIRAMNRDYCKQVPVIAMTANAFAEDVQAAKTVGMNEHIAKPLDLNKLAKTLCKWLLQ